MAETRLRGFFLFTLNHLSKYVKEGFPVPDVKSFDNWAGNLGVHQDLRICISGYDQTDHPCRIYSDFVSIYYSGDIQGEKCLNVMLGFKPLGIKLHNQDLELDLETKSRILTLSFRVNSYKNHLASVIKSVPVTLKIQ